MAAFSVMHPRVRLMCPNVPEMIMDQALREAARKLCTDGWCYKETLANFAATAGQAEYAITLADPDDEIVALVGAVWLDAEGHERPIEAMSDEGLDRKVPSWRLSEGTPVAFVSESLGTLRLAPKPQSNGTVHALRVIKRPKLTVTALPDYLVDNWSEELVMGAQSQILMMPKRAWSNYTIGFRLFKEFNAAAAVIRRRQRFGNTNASLTIAIPNIT